MWDQPRWLRLAIVIGVSLPIFAWVAQLPPVAQDVAYHAFADQRTMLGIPHFWNVVSNLPFAVIGLLGCVWLRRAGSAATTFVHPSERFAYYVFFVGELLTSAGSAWYHAAPANGTLLWDRLTFSLMLTSYFVIVVTEFVNRRVGLSLLWPMVAIGLCSVVYWAWTESLGRGDLRLYAVVQFYPVVAVPFIVWLFRSSYSRANVWVLAWSLYAVAKACEFFDAPIYQFLGVWSGHTLKHFVAAAASFLVLAAVRRRHIAAPA